MNVMRLKITNCIPVGQELLPPQSVYCEDGKILAVTDRELPCDRVYDGGGAYLSPGWIDLHCHGGGSYDFMDGGAEAIREGAKTHLCHGTTSLYPTTLSASRQTLRRAVEDIREAMDFPTVRGAHLEGPYFDPASCGAQNPAYIRGFDREEMEELLSYGVVKRWDFAPELAGSEEAAAFLAGRGVVPAMGHSSATYEELLPAYRQGCRLVTHLYSATSTVVRVEGYRRLGIVESAFLLEDMTAEMIADGHHLPPELLRMIVQVMGAGRLCLVTDAMRAAGMPEGPTVLGSMQEGVPCISEGGVAKLPDRSAFAGSVATADQLVATAYHKAHLPLPRVIEMITKTPARVMGLSHKGQLCPGFDADLVLFNEEIRVQAVFVGGRLMAEHGILQSS